MVTWNEFRSVEPAFAATIEQLFNARRHKTIATISADGSPRISGIECEFTSEHLQFGSMSASRKLADLHRDGRFSLHSPTVDPVEGREAEWPGEAKISGRACAAGVLEGDGAPQGELFVADIERVVFTHLNPEGTALVVEWWSPGAGITRIERA